VLTVDHSEPDGNGLPELRELLDEAFGGDFSDEDLTHSRGGTHLRMRHDGLLVAHAAVVPRRLRVGEAILRCGYVEAVAVRPSHQGLGLGRAVMQAAGEVLHRGFHVGALSTGSPAFYEGLGWRRWQGPTYVVDDGEWRRTPAEDDGVMVLEIAVVLDLTAPIAVERRPGDSW
jgi:aminoglycoside 2'-N-acetyltransferase I